MPLFIETLIVLLVLRYVYGVIFGGENNPLKLSRPFGIAIFVVAFLVLPPAIKAMMLVIGLVYFYFKMTDKAHNTLTKEP